MVKQKNLYSAMEDSENKQIETPQDYPRSYSTTENIYLADTYHNNDYYYGTPSYSYFNDQFIPTDYHYNPNYYNYNPTEFVDYGNQSEFLSSKKKSTELKFIDGRTKRSVTFSKRKKGLMKKAYELGVLTGSEAMVLVASEGGNIFSYTTDKFKRLILDQEELIQKYLMEEDVKGKQN